MNRVYFRITMEDGTVWFASSMLLHTPERTLATVQRQAKRRNVGATYALATREEYAAYHGKPIPVALPVTRPIGGERAA